jgi:hypothetical protein
MIDQQQIWEGCSIWLAGQELISLIKCNFVRGGQVLFFIRQWNNSRKEAKLNLVFFWK